MSIDIDEHKRTYAKSKSLQANYGISLKEYNQMLVDQLNRCAICEVPFTKSPHVDHNHETGEVRGLLCGPCNTGLGMFKDSISNLLHAIKYLQR